MSTHFLNKYNKFKDKVFELRINIEDWLKDTLNIDEINEENLQSIIDFLKEFVVSKGNLDNLDFRLIIFENQDMCYILSDVIKITNISLNKLMDNYLNKSDNMLSMMLCDTKNKLLDLKSDIMNKMKCTIEEYNYSHGRTTVYDCYKHFNNGMITSFKDLSDCLSCHFFGLIDNSSYTLKFRPFPLTDTSYLYNILYRDKVDENIKKLTDKLDDLMSTLYSVPDSKIRKCISEYINLMDTLYDSYINGIEESIEFLVKYIEHLISNDVWVIAEDEPVCSLFEYPITVKQLCGSDIDIGNTMKRLNNSVEDMLSGANMNFGKRELQNQNFIKANYAINDIEKKYESKFKKTDSIKVELFKIKPQKIRNKLNAMYFKKWLGRIPGMYSRYADEAKITENRMKGDPTEILSETAPAYLEKTTVETNNLFKEIIDLSRRITASSDIKAKLNQVKMFCQTYKLEDTSNPKEIEKNIKNECLYRICKCIFQGNQIYGFTPEGIVENGKFPTANHIITSLFIDNAHEQPEQLSVSQIFSKPESISTFAFPEKLINYENLLKKVVNSVSQNFNKKMVSSVHNGLELNFKNYSNSLIRKSSAIDGGDAENAKLNKSLAKSIENGIVAGLDLIIDQKIRVLQCVGTCYDMLGRVQRLAKLCVASLHQVEMSHSDSRHSAGVNNIARNATNIRLNKINANNSTSIQ